MAAIQPKTSRPTARHPIVILGPRRPESIAPTSAPVEQSLRTDTSFLFGAFLMLIFYEWVGVSNFLPILKVLRFSTLLAYGLLIVVILRVGWFSVLQTTIAKLHIAFIVFTVASCLWAVVGTTAFQSIRPHVDYFSLLAIAAVLIDRHSRIRAWCFTCSVVAIALVLINLELLTSDVRQGVFAGGYFLGDGNDFGWGLSVIAPFALFLAVTPGQVAIRATGLLALLCCLFGVVGTQSRGATLSILCVLGYYGLVISRRKALAVVVLCLALPIAAAFAPESYMERLQTLGNVSTDGSAQGRLRAWRAATQMAFDYPLGVGAGNFNSAYGRYYVPADAEGWGAHRWISPHSVYFRVLGEYGFAGLALLLVTIWTDFRENRRSYQSFKGRATSPFRADWPRFVTASLIAYCVSAVFLGGISYPHLYLLSGLTLSATRARSVAFAIPVGGKPKAKAAISRSRVLPTFGVTSGTSR